MPLPPSQITRILTKKVLYDAPRLRGGWAVCTEIWSSICQWFAHFIAKFCSFFFFFQTTASKVLPAPSAVRISRESCEHLWQEPHYGADVQLTVALRGNLAAAKKEMAVAESDGGLAGDFLHSGITTKYALWGAQGDSGFLFCQLHKIKSGLVQFSFNNIPFGRLRYRVGKKQKFSVQ